MKTIGIFIFSDVEELDFVGPYEVFTTINAVLEHAQKPKAVKVILISEDGKDIQGAKGMRVGVDANMSEIYELDILCIPGGPGVRPLINNSSVIDWMKSVGAECEWVTSVCTGVFALSKAGFTEDKTITTHWLAFDEFKALGLEGDLQPGARYQVDGNLVTAAGVSAGIDMALWLTGQLFDPILARAVQRVMEYDPAPPYAAEV